MGWQDDPIVEDIKPSPWASDPVVQESKPKYLYAPPKKFGDDEDIHFEESGETIKVPYGSSGILADIMQDDAFDSAVGPSSTLEETFANLEHQAGMAALVFNAWGSVPDSDAANFAADRKKALVSAQKRAPEYMRKFYKDMDNAKGKGFFANAGVWLDNPRGLGRMTITQAPNSIIPLVSSIAESRFGAFLGARVGAMGGPATAASGAFVGGAVGARAGIFQGSLFQEAGSQIDEIMTKDGIDTSDGDELFLALNNTEYMNDVKAKALRKGLTTATVETLFQLIGGRIVKKIGADSKARKAAKAAMALASETVGEVVGEAAGQAAREKDVRKIDWQDAMLEGVASLSQSVGQVGIESSISGGKKVAKTILPKTEEAATSEAIPPDTEINLEEQATQTDALESEIVAADPIVPVSESRKVVDDFMAGRDVDVSAFDEAKQTAVQRILDKAKPVRDKIVAGRVRKLDADIETTLNELDAVESELEIARAEGTATKALENRAEKLANEWQEMDAERGQLFTIEDLSSETADLLDKDITVKGQQLESLSEKVTKESVRAVNRSFREARNATKKDIKALHKTLTKAIQESGLNKSEQASFINSITSIQSVEQLATQAPKIQRRIEAKLSKRLRKDTLAAIKDKLANVKKSKVIAVDFVKQIEALVDDVDTKKRSPQAIDEMQATLDFMAKNPDAEMPKNVVKRLSNLNKRRIESVSTDELQDILNDINRLIAQGKTKLELLKTKRERKLQKWLEELSRDSVPISDKKLKRAPIGERLSAMDEARGKFTTAANKVQRLGIFKNPMDVIFDIFDGVKDYKGANHRIFKQSADRAFSKYLNLKESLTREVKDLTDKLGLDSKNFERIGVYAAAQQENGVEKLLYSGVTQKEIDSLKLSDEEMQMYNLMREKLDSMRPALKEVMRLVYNKDFTEVKDYFPFMTDFAKMDTLEIQDMFGDSPVAIDVNKKNVNKEFTIERKGGDQKIKLDAMNVFLSHVDNATYLIEMGETIRDLSDLAASESFAEISGDLGQEIVLDWLDLLARKGKVQGRDAVLDALRRNAGFAMLGFKLTTTLVQITALADGAALVGGWQVARGVRHVGDITKHGKAWRKFLRDNMPEIRERAGDDPAYLDMGGEGKLASAREMGFWALKNVDLLAASSVAAGAYIKSVESRGGTVDFSNPDQQAIEDAQLMMRRTQSSAFFKDQAPIFSQGKLTGTLLPKKYSSVSWDKILLQFQSFLFNRWSIIEHDLYRAGIRGGKTKQAANAATWLILANMADGLIRRGLEEATAAMLQLDIDPWEDEIEKDVLHKALGNVPFVGSIVNSLEYGSVPVPAFSLIGKVVKEIALFAQSKDPDKKLQHALQGSFLSLGSFVGFPGAASISSLVGKIMKDDKPSGGF